MKFLFFFTGLVLLSSLGFSQFPSLDASPGAYEYHRLVNAQDARNYWRDIAAAALWASSLNAGPGAEEKAAALMNRIAGAVEELSAMPDLPRQSRERAEYVLTFLHRRFLKSYSEYQTRVDEIFVSGRYNCVSSAVLYMVLGFSVDLDISGVVTKDHAFVTVNTGSAPVDVETTNPYGFDPGNRREFHDNFGKTTGFVYVPARNYRDRVTINAPEMVSLILSNRIAILERGSRYADAVPLAINRAVLLRGTADSLAAEADQGRAEFFEDPHRDIMNRLFNFGSNLVKTGKEDQALAWALYAGARFPSRERWQEFIYAAVNNKLVKLIRSKKTADARTALNTLGPVKEKLSPGQYQALDLMVLEAEGAEMINGIKNPGDVEAALAFLSRLWEQLPEQRREEMRTTAVLKEAERIGRSGDWARGMDWLKGAIEKYGPNTRLESVRRTFRQNRVGELHNQFASLFNKRDYRAAREFIQQALAEFPGESRLMQDLTLVERALGQ
ncbi:MAG: hypothetical protein LBE02_03925 [Spirochaetaceae bacterium]|jgi:tetratricopeptide (TPR) repeat protein|nr:hypothetical protein [Spirochaetaceae bacterium]